MASQGEGLSLSELARQLGRAKSGLHKLASRGQIPKGADGTFDLEAVKNALATNTDPARQRDAFTPVHGRENGERVAAQAEQDALLATTRVREILRAEGVEVAAEGPMTWNHVRTAETIVKIWQRDLLHEEAKGALINADEAERRWADEMVKLRARLLSVSGKVSMRLSHLTPHEVQEIDQIVRDVMSEAAGADGDAA